MSDLPSGSTVGGKLIIHKGIATDHTHVVADIDGLSASGSQGDGGGIDAAVLSGKTFSDLNNEFLSVANDSITGLLLDNHPTSDTHATSKLYVSQRASEGFTNGDFYGLTSIGTVSQELSYVVLNQYVVRINETDIMVNGWLGVMGEQNIDIRDTSPNITNKSFYLFVESVENEFTITVSETKDLNTATRIYAGRIDTDYNGIAHVEIVSGVSRFGIGKYMLSQIPAPDSIVISKDTGLIDDGWLVGSKGETYTFLDGPTTLESDEEGEYKITNYNSFSVYTVEVDDPTMTVNISGDMITAYAPSHIPLDRTATLRVYRDGFESRYVINLKSDPMSVLTGPQTVSARESNNYSIVPYDSYYDYDVSVLNLEGLEVGEINEDNGVVTVNTGNTNPYQQSGHLVLEREGKSFEYPITYLADNALTISGPTVVNSNRTYVYTIGNYYPGYNYTVTATHGTFSISGNRIVLNTTGIPASARGNNIRLTVSREGSSAYIDILFRAMPTPVVDAGKLFSEYGGYYTGGNIRVGGKEYAVIIAPKELGEANLPWKTSNTTTSGTKSTNNGKANMDAIIAAGINNHPAAKFCHELNINGFDDWHLPSPDELEICYRYLKPSTQGNNTGGWPHHGTGNGTNPNSVPVGAAYTASNPSRTSVVDFMEGGSQAFGTFGDHWWTSMEATSLFGWHQSFYNGIQHYSSKTIPRFARAVRWVEV